jgi:hypothetical protein
MNELIYKLDIPPLDQVLDNKFDLRTLVPENFVGSKILYYHPREIFKNEWCNFLGYEWDYVSCFIRSGKQQSIIHRDNPHSPTQLHWGINWTLGARSLMEYWPLEDIEQESIIKDNGNKETVLLKTTKQPFKTYTLEPGAYLVNASIPHRATNLEDNLRFVVSLRSKKIRNTEEFKTWNNVVDRFSFLFQQNQ